MTGVKDRPVTEYGKKSERNNGKKMRRKGRKQEGDGRA
jgi:hypothetical protein